MVISSPTVQEVEFLNDPQRQFYYARARNQCFSGGFNNGKSWVGCLKAYSLLTTFPRYRIAICRQVRADLMKTTYQTFFKICPREAVEAQNTQEGWTILKNGSRIDWLHMDNIEDSTLRGLELNSYLWDQAEEGEEKTFDILNARIGRWDGAEVPKELLEAYPDWPKNEKTGKYLIPSYGMVLVNPDTQYHFIYRKFHPDSIERVPEYFFVEGQWDSNMGSKEAYEQALTHDEEWVAKYVKGQWGISNAQIHRVWPESLLDYTPELIEKIKSRGRIYRVLDHGETSPTCCLWVAVLDGNFIFFQEYYVPNQVISYHRKGITDLSEGFKIDASYADPQIFKKTGQKEGAYWTTADEYGDSNISGPPIHWIPADNNEFATRNRINELLRPQIGTKHPISGDVGRYPRIYFVKKSAEWNHGCDQAIRQIGSQRRKLIGYVDGKSIYSDDREESIEDHSYDCVRYMIAMHATGKAALRGGPPRRSFAYYKMMADRQKNLSRMRPA